MAADPGTLAPLLRARAAARGGHPLLVCDDEKLSYAEAERRSAALARILLARGIGRGDHVGVLHPNGPRFVVAAFAAARIGAVTVGFSTLAAPAELRYQIGHSDITLMLATPAFRGNDYRRRLAEAAPELPVCFDLDAPAPAAGPDALAAAEAAVTPEDPMALIYTSGSTGNPKGVLLGQAGLLAQQRRLNAVRGLTAADRLFCNSPFCWVGGFAFALLATLTAGATLICSNATDPSATLDLLERERPTVGNGFAAGVAQLARHPSFAGRDLSTLRRGNLYPLMPAELRPADPALRHNLLGMTEAGSVVLIDGDERDQPEHRRGSFGRPAPGFEATVLDPRTGGPVPVGAPGELCLRGPYLMQGYHRVPRADCFDADGWFHTGDLVRTDPDGYYYFLGRRGAMIKTAGANVSPTEVQDAVLRLLGDAAAVYVLGLPDAERGELVAAVIATEDPAGVDLPALRAALRRELSAYKVPRRFLLCRPAEIPLLASGKPDLPALRGLLADS